MGEVVLSYDIDNGLWFNHYNNYLSNNLEVLTRGGDSKELDNTGILSFNAVSLGNDTKHGYRITIS